MKVNNYVSSSNRLFRKAILAVLFFLACAIGSSPLHAQSFTIPFAQTTLNASVGNTSYGEIDFYNQTNNRQMIYLTIEGTDASAFSVSTRLVYLGDSTDTIRTRGIRLDFSPISYRVHTAKLIATDSNGTTDTLQLTGNGIGGGFYAYIGGENDYVPTGSTACNTIKLVNASSVATTLTSIALGTTDSDVWTTQYITINDSNLTFPLTVAGGDSVMFEWCFNPQVHGYYFADSLILGFHVSSSIPQTEATILQGRSTLADAPDSECAVVTGNSADTLILGTVAAGGSEFGYFTLTNPTYAECIIDSIEMWGIDSTKFYANVVDPVTLPSIIYYRDSSRRLSISFMTPSSDPDGVYHARATIHTTLHDGGITHCDRYLYLRATVLTPLPPDTIKLDLAPDSSEVVDFPDSVVGCQLVEILNNTDSAMKIDTIFMKSGVHFSVYYVPTYLNPDSTFPATIAAHTMVYAYVCLIDSGMSSYDDTLVIVTEHALTSLEFPTHWRAKAQHQAVQLLNPASSVVLSANPNPSSGNIRFSFAGVQNATVQILDLLGRTVMEKRSANSLFDWNGLTLSGSTAAKGAYIARVTGKTSDGKSVTLSQRVMIVR